MDGQRLRIDRPRARKNGQELSLDRHNALQERTDLREYVERVMLADISTRNYEKILQPWERALDFREVPFRGSSCVPAESR